MKVVIAAIVAFPISSYGQEPHDSTMHKMPGMKMEAVQDSADMMMPGPLGISMDRMGSGTTWIPDAVAIPSFHIMKGQWTVMLHGFVFGQFNNQSGPRGDTQFGSLNWGMLMASRDVGGGKFQARTMLSLDPLTVTHAGYPLLLQTGEMYQGESLVDRQHPHDFFMELGALYEKPFTNKVAGLLYAALSGEPALGPVAFMHRPSAMDDPTAPLGHHWQDATHISFGVLTAGLFTKHLRIEGSSFNGREPDENRWGFDRIKLDSYSGRLTFNPSSHWSFTAGYGELKSPEEHHPDESVRRAVASMLYGSRQADQSEWSAALVWGANMKDGEATTHSLLAEGEFLRDGANTFTFRGEYVQKTAEELLQVSSEERFAVKSISFGYIREILKLVGTSLGLGARVTVNFVPPALESAYGSSTPRGLLIFARLRPRHIHNSHRVREGR